MNIFVFVSCTNYLLEFVD